MKSGIKIIKKIALSDLFFSQGLQLRNISTIVSCINICNRIFTVSGRTLILGQLILYRLQKKVFFANHTSFSDFFNRKRGALTQKTERFFRAPDLAIIYFLCVFFLSLHVLCVFYPKGFSGPQILQSFIFYVCVLSFFALSNKLNVIISKISLIGRMLAIAVMPSC